MFKSRSKPLKKGERFLHFDLVRPIACGGVAEVDEVMHQGKRYALKRMQRRWISDPILVRSMRNEAQALVGIKHPYIVEAHDWGEHEGVVWILLELIEGHSLRDEITKRAPLSIPLTCAYLRSAALATHLLHSYGVIHRDIKPENFMVPKLVNGQTPYVKLIDLGIARFFKSTDTLKQGPIGTPLYMAPEQWNTHIQLTQAADIYPLGVSGYEMLVEHPFRKWLDQAHGMNVWQLACEHWLRTPRSLEEFGIATEIARVIMKAMAKHPADRHATALEFVGALDGALAELRARDPNVDTLPGEPPVPALVTEREALHFTTSRQLASSSRPVAVPASYPSTQLYAPTAPLPPALVHTQPSLAPPFPTLPFVPRPIDAAAVSERMLDTGEPATTSLYPSHEPEASRPWSRRERWMLALGASNAVLLLGLMGLVVHQTMSVPASPTAAPVSAPSPLELPAPSAQLPTNKGESAMAGKLDEPSIAPEMTAVPAMTATTAGSRTPAVLAPTTPNRPAAAQPAARPASSPKAKPSATASTKPSATAAPPPAPTPTPTGRLIPPRPF